MDLLTLFVSFNKLSLLAFIVVLGFLGYEIHAFKKESKKGSKPVIPRFTGDTPLKTANATFVKEENGTIERKDIKIFIVLGVLLVVFGVLTLIGFTKVGTDTSASSARVSPVTYTASNGIQVFNEDFTVLTENEISTLTAGKRIIIGVETVREADIDRARIRVNRPTWNLTDVTTQFNKDLNVYYISYEIPQDATELTIEAQLHSAEDGWLGD